MNDNVEIYYIDFSHRDGLYLYFPNSGYVKILRIRDNAVSSRMFIASSIEHLPLVDKPYSVVDSVLFSGWLSYAATLTKIYSSQLITHQNSAVREFAKHLI